MNRWIECEDQIVNLDLYHRIILVTDKIKLVDVYGESDILNFISVEEAKEFYDKIKSKLNLKEWE